MLQGRNLSDRELQLIRELRNAFDAERAAERDKLAIELLKAEEELTRKRELKENADAEEGRCHHLQGELQDLDKYATEDLLLVIWAAGINEGLRLSTRAPELLIKLLMNEQVDVVDVVMG